MNFRTTRLFWLLPALALAFPACQEEREPETTTTEDQPLSVFVVNYPLHYFAERIGANRVEVRFPAPGDVDPAEWMPDDATILDYQGAGLILLNGAGYARWAGHASLPANRTVNTAREIQEHLLEVPDAMVHSHGDGDTHSHAGTAFTTWLDPLLAIEHARVVKEALSERLPSHAEEFAGRFDDLAADLRALDETLAEITSQDAGRPLLTSHPVYHYLEARYSLNLKNLHWEPDEMPSASEWDALDEKLEDHPAEWILWEDEPLEAIAERLEERNIRSLVYHPCSQPPDGDDFLGVMRQNKENLARAFASD